MRWLTIAALALAALTFAVAGCGGGDEASDDTDTVAIDTTETETDETTDGDTTEDTETETDGSGSVAAGDCAELLSAQAALVQAFAASGEVDEAADVGTFFESFAENAPEEVRSDFAVIAKAYSEYIEAIADIDVDPGGVPSADAAQAIQEALAAFSVPEVTAASERINAWVASSCPGG